MEMNLSYNVSRTCCNKQLLKIVGFCRAVLTEQKKQAAWLQERECQEQLLLRYSALQVPHLPILPVLNRLLICLQT